MKGTIVLKTISFGVYPDWESPLSQVQWGGAQWVNCLAEGTIKDVNDDMVYKLLAEYLVPIQYLVNAVWEYYEALPRNKLLGLSSYILKIF